MMWADSTQSNDKGEVQAAGPKSCFRLVKFLCKQLSWYLCLKYLGNLGIVSAFSGESACLTFSLICIMTLVTFQFKKQSYVYSLKLKVKGSGLC